MIAGLFAGQRDVYKRRIEALEAKCEVLERERAEAVRDCKLAWAERDKSSSLNMQLTHQAFKRDVELQTERGLVLKLKRDYDAQRHEIESLRKERSAYQARADKVTPLAPKEQPMQSKYIRVQPGGSGIVGLGSYVDGHNPDLKTIDRIRGQFVYQYVGEVVEVISKAPARLKIGDKLTTTKDFNVRIVSLHGVGGMITGIISTLEGDEVAQWSATGYPTIGNIFGTLRIPQNCAVSRLAIIGPDGKEVIDK